MTIYLWLCINVHTSVGIGKAKASWGFGVFVPCYTNTLSMNDGMDDILGIAVNEKVLPFFCYL